VFCLPFQLQNVQTIIPGDECFLQNNIDHCNATKVRSCELHKCEIPIFRLAKLKCNHAKKLEQFFDAIFEQRLDKN